jgi:hypothetical protein
MELVFENLRVEDLFNTGTATDHQDPALTIKIGNLVKGTKRSESFNLPFIV